MAKIIATIPELNTVTANEKRAAFALCASMFLNPETIVHGMGFSVPDDFIGPAWLIRVAQVRTVVEAYAGVKINA